MPVGVSAFFEPVVAQPPSSTLTAHMPVLPLRSSNNIFAKLLHPLAQLLNQVAKYNVSSLDSTLVFLLFLNTLAIQVRTLALEVRPMLALLFSKLVQPLADVVGLAIQNGYDLDRLHDHVLRSYVPERARVTVMQRHYYRVQRVNEPLIEYIREIKMYSRVLPATSVEKEVVDNILSGLTPSVRSCLNFESRPNNFEKLNALCIRVSSTHFADSVRINSGQRSAPPRPSNLGAMVEGNVQSSTQRNIICYHCCAPGHVIRNCPNRNRSSPPAGAGQEMNQPGNR